jgi:hypothetical protein
LTKISIEGLEILDEIPIDYDDWEESAPDEKWVIRTLKLWFFMQKNYNIVNRWAAWPEILSDKDFIKRAMAKIEEVVDDFGEYILEKVENFALDDPAIVMQLEVLLHHLGGPDLTDPHNDDTDSSVGTFLMFAVRDALIYCGLLPSCRVLPGRQYALAAHKETFYTQNIGFLKAMLFTK